MRRRQMLTFFPQLAILVLSLPAWAGIDAAKEFLDGEIGTTSVLSRAQQEAEMQWFIDAAEPYQDNFITKFFSSNINKIAY